jgi:hypothetical protein
MRSIRYAALFLVLAAALAGSVAFHGYGLGVPRGPLVVFLALLALILAVGLANSGDGDDERSAAPSGPPEADPMPGVVAGVQVALSPNGISVPFENGWKDFPDYRSFVLDPSFPPGATELELAEPEGATFAVIGTRGAVLGPDGSILLEHGGETGIYPDWGALFADPRTAGLAPQSQSKFLIDLFGRSFIPDPDGELVPVRIEGAAGEASLADLVTDPEHAYLFRRYSSKLALGTVFAAAGGWPVRLRDDGTVEWVRADGVFRFDDIVSAVAAISRH